MLYRYIILYIFHQTGETSLHSWLCHTVNSTIIMMDYPVVHSRFSFPLAEKTGRGDSFFCLCFFHWNGQGLHYSVPDIRFTEWCNTPIKLWWIGWVPSGSCALIGQTPSFPSALTGWTLLGIVIWFAEPSALICSDSNICKVWSMHTLVRTVSHSSTAAVWELLLHSWKSSPVRSRHTATQTPFLSTQIIMTHH